MIPEKAPSDCLAPPNCGEVVVVGFSNAEGVYHLEFTEGKVARYVSFVVGDEFPQWAHLGQSLFSAFGGRLVRSREALHITMNDDTTRYELPLEEGESVLRLLSAMIRGFAPNPPH